MTQGPTVTRDFEESGRPGSNRHLQLGRSAKAISAYSHELRYQGSRVRGLA